MSGSNAVLLAPKAAVTPKPAADVYVENAEKDPGYHFVRKAKVTIDRHDGTCQVLEGYQIDPNYPKGGVNYQTAAAGLAKDGYVPVQIGKGADAITLFVKKTEPKDTFANKDMALHNILNGKSTDKAPTTCALSVVGANPPKTTGAAPKPKSDDLKTPPEWFKSDCVRVRIGQIVSFYKIVPAKDGVKVTFKNDKGVDQDVYLSLKDATDYYARLHKNDEAKSGDKDGDVKWMFYHKTKDGWQTTDKASMLSKP
jgi:hypothetical protein